MAQKHSHAAGKKGGAWKILLVLVVLLALAAGAALLFARSEINGRTTDAEPVTVRIEPEGFGIDRDHRAFGNGAIEIAGQARRARGQGDAAGAGGAIRQGDVLGQGPRRHDRVLAGPGDPPGDVAALAEPRAAHLDLAARQGCEAEQ